jgi:NADH dehydrogenase
MIPYFGSGCAKVQPVAVEDVAFCVVESLFRADTTGKVFELGGPRAYTWTEFYNACRAVMPQARAWKPMVSIPVPVAKLLAALTAGPMAVGELIVPAIGSLRFDSGQVQMTQRDNVCDHTIAEQAFGVRMRSFEDELARYVHRIP